MSTESQLRAYERQTKAPDRDPSFVRVTIGPTNIIDTTKRTSKAGTATAKATTKPDGKDRHVAAVQLTEPQYDIDVDLSSKSSASAKTAHEIIWTEPLVNPIPGTTFQVRASVTQHHAGEPFQGVKLDWRLPVGWAWADNKGQYTYHEFVSNPVRIQRLAKYLSGVEGWRVIIAEWYR